jgi:hypothetical protein
MNTATWSEIVYYLNGSCNSLHEALEAFNMTELGDDDTFLAFLDDQIFYCVQCGWWCPVDELHIVDAEQYCSDCV